MARIPMGNFGQVVPTAERNHVVTFDTERRGEQALAGAVAGVAGQVIDQKKQEDDALARVKASNQLLDRESQLNSITADLDEKLRTGALAPDQAQAAYQTAVGALEPMQPQGLDAVGVENFNLSLRKMQMQGAQGIEHAVGKA